jgi:hypothetical protein
VGPLLALLEKCSELVDARLFQAQGTNHEDEDPGAQI